MFGGTVDGEMGKEPGEEEEGEGGSRTPEMEKNNRPSRLVDIS